MKFNRLSPTTDFYSKFQSQLQVISGNVLYLTHEIDKIHKIIKELSTDKGLQKQVDQYFEDPFDGSRTSPQTDQEEQDGSD